MSRDLLDVADFDAGEVDQILGAGAAADRPTLGRPLDGLGAALIFEKPSNRTRQSMEMAVVQLGGHPVYTRGEEVGFDMREPVEDVARILARATTRVIAARVVLATTRSSGWRPSPTCRSSTCCPTARTRCRRSPTR